MDMNKIVRIGTGEDGDIFCKIRIKDGKLSISGVIGPMKNGCCRGGWGQINMSAWNMVEYAKGWNNLLVAVFLEIWNKWHLNDLRAGSPMQQLILSQVKDKSYDNACKVLSEVGYHPDPGYLYNGEPFRYGSVWLKEDLPQYVVDFLQALPETDIQPAWV